MTGINTTDTVDNQPSAEQAQSSNVDEMKEAVKKSQKETPVVALNGVKENGVAEAVPNGDASEDEKTTTTNGVGDKEDASGESGETGDAPKAAEDDKKDNCDVVLIQDTGFLIKIVAPGIEPFDLPVSMMELVQEIYQVLIDREDTCHRTCFSLQLDGTTLDNFAELKTIEGLKEGSVINVVEDLYNVREARIHVRHVRDLLKSVDHSDAYNGLDCNSLSFINTVTEGDILDRKYKKPDQIDCTPPDYILPASKERPIMPLHPVSKDLKAPECLKVLTYSGWNPPPGNRKMHGDLLYLYIVTLEEKRYHVTASTRGFYVNQSTQDEFNPKAAQQHHLSHSLIDLLSQMSPAFKKNFSILLKKRAQKHPFERVATPYQVYSWLAPQTQHTIDSIRAEDAFSSRLGYEEHIPGQTRDWNEELQTTRELPRKTLPERLIRERAIFKVHSDFVVAATRGAMAVIDGNIMAINPGEEAKMQMYLWNNIFFSLGFDVKDHYEAFGGDAAAFVAPSNDLQGVRAYSSVDTEGLYTLGTVVVDYRGYRITAQSIIPGILEREQEQSVVYGSIDFGKTVVNHEKYMELLKKTASTLKICPHNVKDEKGEEVELLSSVECKGIIGNDGRHYVLDLLRTFPMDVNYLPMDDEELNEEVRAMGYPKKHRHRLACLRHELIDAFVETQYVAFVKNAALQFQQLRLKKAQQAEKKQEEDEKKDGEKVVSDDPPDEKLETEEMKKMVEALTETSAESFEDSTKEVVKKAALSVGSLSETEFNITFNSDVFQPHVRHANPESEDFAKQKQLVKDAAAFLLTHQIPNFMKDCLEHNSSPIDGYTLSEALHHNGINIRYLGKVTQLIGKYQQLSYLHSICISELLCRAAKHLFTIYMQGIEMMSLSGAISHFLNCFLGSFPTPHTPITSDELHSQRAKKRNRKKNKAVLGNGTESTEWASETPKTLWKKIIDEVNTYYGYKIDEESLDAALEKYELQRVSLFRSFCKKIGLQIALHEYNLESRTKQAFHEEDIINIFPVVKHIHPKATDAYHVFTSGQQKIQQGLLRDGYELIQEALNLLNNVYGAMHPEIAACARLLARLNYIMGEYAEALAFQQRAVLMSERVLGIDHPNTITEYAHLALYCFANNQISSALRLMYRARYLALLCHGESHPEVALFDSNIGLILQAVEEFDLSLRFLQKALELNTKFFGPKSLKVAMSFHLVARAYACKGDFRTGLNNEKEAYSIYKAMLGDEHERTRESSECLKQLTSQAVKFQKTMNEIYKGETAVSIPPLQLQHPTPSNVLDTLNLINGIVFVHISQEDIDKFREEMIRRHEQTQGQKSEEDTNTSPAVKDSDASTAESVTDGTTSESVDSKPSTPETTVNSQETDVDSR